MESNTDNITSSINIGGSNKLHNRKIVDDINHEEYDKLPIENFGKEMLMRMGWKENQPIKGSGPLEPIVFKPRNFRLGLGADPVIEEGKFKQYDSNKNKIKFCYGTKIKIISGKHKGLKGKIIERDLEYEYLNKIIKEKKKEILSVELKLNRQIIKIEADKIKLRHDKSSKSKDKQKSKDQKSRSRSESSSKSLKYAKKEENIFGIKSPNNDRRPKLSWVYPNILVRIISKNSKYYNTKAVIVDLLDLYSFSLYTLKDKILHTEFTEGDIETVMPKLNEEVTILVKEHRGEIAKLLIRDKKKNEVSVQLFNDLSIMEYTQDEVAATSNIKF